MRNISILITVTLMFFTSCASVKTKDISYLTTTKNLNLEKTPSLSVYSPKKSKVKDNPVLLFVHGGNWNSGDKKMYEFIGRNFAKKGITTVLVGYTLSPEANYDVMAREIAAAVVWTKENIANYGGNPDNIYLTGHSAGAHLVALIGTNPKYLEDNSIIKGIILNDAAGLDMKYYLENNPPTTKDDYLATWGNDHELWKDAAPIYFIDAKTPKFMIYLGEKTYESIKIGTARFTAEINKFQPNVKPLLMNKKHVFMVAQYIYPWSKRYDEIIKFMTD